MFGYVRTFDAELKIGQYRTYKAIYCGLCKQLGRSFGPMARMTLSYDFTFLATLSMAVKSEAPQFSPQSCMINPLKKSPCCLYNDSLSFSADCAMILLWHKLSDNLADEGFWRNIGTWFLRLFAKRPFLQASQRHPDIAKAASQTMQSQAQLETERCADPDMAAHPTATLLEEIFTMLSEQEKERRILGRMGYLMGRFIYLCDALDDLSDDRKKGRYNPFLMGDCEDEQQMIDNAKGALYLTVSELSICADLLNTHHMSGIIENVLHLGLKNSVDAVITSKTSRKEHVL